MAGKDKKMTAALAAVSLYLEQEQAIMAGQQEVLEEPKITDSSEWGQSGRQEMMIMRRLTELRTFRRLY